MSLVDHALHYAARGWPVFAVSGFKMPYKGSHGHLDATTDPVAIEARWREKPHANIGLATGDIVVIDADRPEALAKLKATAARFGGLPYTLVAKTTRGWHFYYRAPVGKQLRCWAEKRAVKGAPGIDIKAHGGFVVLPPSLNRVSGLRYEWMNAAPIAELPAWVAEHLIVKPRPAAQPPQVRLELGPLPAWCEASGTLENADSLLRSLMAAERPAIVAALALIPAGLPMNEWFAIGGAIHDFDPSESGLELFEWWSAKSERHQEDVANGICAKTWATYEKKQGLEGGTTKNSIYWYAEKYTTLEVVEKLNKEAAAEESTLTFELPAVVPPPEAGKTNGHTSAEAMLPAYVTQETPTRRPIWVDKTEDGDPRPTTTNAGLAIGYLGIRCAKDAFHEKLIVGGQVIERWAGALSDEVVLMLRKAIKRAYDFDPGDNNCRSAAVQLCLENQFNPVVDYLDALRWDGVPRVARLAAGYLGATDTPLNSEIGRLMLVAAVRRARAPGTKFDQIIVLEGREGTMKSTAIKILAGEDNFSDQNVLAASDKEQQEALTGVWLHEIAELAGMRRAEVERIKQFASRTEDRARPAFGRLRVDHKRTSVLIATTNEKTYLQSDTGNRRFWPIRTGKIDAGGLIRDRDQLWAEAAAMEKAGGSLVLDPKLWADAGVEQEARRVSDAWEHDVQEAVGNLKDVAIREILIGQYFRMEMKNIGQAEQNRVARILHRMGFERYQKRNGERREWRYRLENA